MIAQVFFFFEIELILQSKKQGKHHDKPAKQDSEAYQIVQMDLKKEG